MKKILILFLTVYMSILSFSQINDKLGVLNKDERVNLEEKDRRGL